VAKPCNGIEEMGDSASCAIWELNSRCWRIFRIQMIFDEMSDFVWSKFHWLALQLHTIFKGGSENAFVKKFGWNTFSRCSAHVPALFSSLLAQPPTAFL